jgi:hypothetical protein
MPCSTRADAILARSPGKDGSTVDGGGGPFRPLSWSPAGVLLYTDRNGACECRHVWLAEETKAAAPAADKGADKG